MDHKAKKTQVPLVNLGFSVTSEGANLPRLNWLTSRPKPTIYLCWLGSNPGGFTEIRRKLTQQRAKQQPEFSLSEGQGGVVLWEGFGKDDTEQRRSCSVQNSSVWCVCALTPALWGLCQIPVLSTREFWLGVVLRGKHRGGSSAALREAAKSLQNSQRCSTG